MPRKTGPEAKIIALFNALPDDSKRIVLDVLKSQQPVVKRPKSQSVANAAKKSKPKNADNTATLTTEDPASVAWPVSGD